MRIVSLLPSLTELVCALGKEDLLVGVSHECDYPPEMDKLPKLTSSRIKTSASSAEIDRMVVEQSGRLYDLDSSLLAELRPDLILTQSQCDVCAVNERTVREVAAGLPGSPPVESVNPTTLIGVFAMFRRIGELIDAREEAEKIVAGFDALAAEIAKRRAGLEPPRVLLLEWFDPPFNSGHWNPDLTAIAGGRETLGRAGVPSRQVTWDEVAATEAEVVLLSPCGFTLERAETELDDLFGRTEFEKLPAARDDRVALIDGSAYFSRPGPRLVDSLGIAAAAIDPGRCGDLAPTTGWRLPALPKPSGAAPHERKRVVRSLPAGRADL